MRNPKKALELGRRYAAGPGAAYNDETAEVLGQMVEDIVRRGEEVTPKLIVELGKPKSSPIHDIFTWDDKKAAEAHRLNEARHALSCLLVITSTGEDAHTEKALFNIKTVQVGDPNQARREYVQRSDVFSSEYVRLQIKQDALRELRLFREKYSSLGFEEFAPIYEAVENIGMK